MYFILKTLKGYTLSLLTVIAFTGLISSLASLTLLFVQSDSFALDELLLAPSQLPMGQGLQPLRADIIHDSQTCNKELEIFLDHAGRNCVLIEYVSNTTADKLNDFHFMQLIKINYWLFDDESHSGSFYQSLLENPVTLPLNQTKDFYLSLSYNFSLMAENYSVFYYDSSVVQAKTDQQTPIHGLTILQESNVVAEILVQGFQRNHSPWLGLHWLHRLSVAVLHVTASKPGPLLWMLKTMASLQEGIIRSVGRYLLQTFPSVGENFREFGHLLIVKLSEIELKEIHEYEEGTDRYSRLIIAAIIILILHKIQSYYVSFEEEGLSMSKCEALLSAFTCRNRRLNAENKASIEG